MNVGAKIMLTGKRRLPAGGAGSHLLCPDAGRMVGQPETGFEEVGRIRNENSAVERDRCD